MSHRSRNNEGPPRVVLQEETVAGHGAEGGGVSRMEAYNIETSKMKSLVEIGCMQYQT